MYTLNEGKKNYKSNLCHFFFRFDFRFRKFEKRFSVKITLIATYRVIHWVHKRIIILSINKLSICSMTIIFLFNHEFSQIRWWNIFLLNRKILQILIYVRITNFSKFKYQININYVIMFAFFSLKNTSINLSFWFFFTKTFV